LSQTTIAPAFQVLKDKFKARTCHRYPDANQDKINPRLDPAECLTKITFAKVNKTAQSSFGEELSRRCGFQRFIFSADDASGT
jgi:hypothetical protein